MQRTYWPEWKNYLSQRGLKPLACILLSQARALFPLAAQVMTVGLPLFKGQPSGPKFVSLLDTLGDADHLQAFSDYLQEVGS